MTNKNMETMAVGIAVTMAAGTLAYMSMHKSPMETKMKKLKRSTTKALKGVSTIASDISSLVG